MSVKKYLFEDVLFCEMCGDDSLSHSVMGLRLNTSQGLRPKNKSGIAVSVKKCKKCNLIYSSPMPIPGNIQDHYGVPPETYWKPSYFEWNSNYFAAEINQLKKILPFQNGMKALDIGAGVGKCMVSLQKAGFDVYGFEASKPFYERAITQMGISPDKLQFGMMEDLEYPKEYFDFITFGAVLEHLYHPAASLEKAFEWLKPNGIIQIEVPSSKHLIPKLINFYYRAIGSNFVTNISPMHEPFHLYEFGLDSFKFLGEKLDYKIAHYEYYNCDIYFIPKLFHPVLDRIMKATNTGMQLAIWLKKN